VGSKDTGEIEAKSQKDPLFIKIPDAIHLIIPVEVTVYVNDEVTPKEANYVIISTGNAWPYSTSAEEVMCSSSGRFRGAIRYNGQEKIRFGFRPIDALGGASVISVEFVKAKALLGNEWPSTTDEKSEFYRWNCNHEYNELLCGGGEEGCNVCHKHISYVSRLYVTSKTVDGSVPPTGFEFVNQEKEHCDYCAGSERFTFSKETEMQVGTALNTYTQIYDITLRTL
jgi:hypothetical protein